MSDLFASLNSAARALEAQRTGLNVVGQNIANVNSPGYTRRALTFSPIPPTEKFSAGRGVTVTDIHSQRDRLIERRLRTEISGERKQATMADTLSVVELELGKAGTSLDTHLSAFFNAFSTLAEDPTSAVSRNEVREEATTLAAQFRNLAGGLDRARREADVQIGGVVDEINNLVGRISALNQTIATSKAEMALTPSDEQGLLVRQLSELVDINALDRNDGGIDIFVGSGRPLVIGNTGYPIEETPTGPTGFLDLATGDFTITDEIAGGKLGGLLEIRDVTIPGYQARLDEIAYNVAQEVNTLHQSGYDLAGNAGDDFFSFSTAIVSSTGAAAAIRLDPAIAADPTLIVAAGIAEPGDNTIARALAALRDVRVLDGGTATFNDAWGQLVYRVGRDVSNAELEQNNRGEVVNQVEMLRDQVSGISLDEEAAQMLRFQRAYEANARFFRVIDDTLDMLMAYVQ